jgi:glycosyltransferase involved in cell wall biosynthesis
LRLLFLISHLTGAGAERQTGYLAAELQRRGHEVLVGYVVEGPGVRPGDVPVQVLPPRRVWSPLLVADCVRLIRVWQPELVQTCLTRMDTMGAIACRLTDTPFVLREANSADFYGRELKTRLREMTGRAAEAIVANSQGGARYWAKAAPRVPRFVIPNGIAPAAAEPAERPGNPVGVYAGRLIAEKNVDVLLRACAAADRDITLFVCGTGPERPRLEALAKELGLDARFTGFVDDVERYQRAADFAALLSDFEGHPNAAAEAFAAGTPIVLSDVDAHRGFSGEALLVPLHDVESTAAAIRSILDERPVKRIARARARAAQWSIEAMTDAYERVYANVARASARGTGAG